MGMRFFDDGKRSVFSPYLISRGAGESLSYRLMSDEQADATSKGCLIPGQLVMTVPRSMSAEDSGDRLVSELRHGFLMSYFLPTELMTETMLSEFIFWFLDILSRWARELSSGGSSKTSCKYKDDSISISDLCKIWEAICAAKSDRMPETDETPFLRPGFSKNGEDELRAYGDLVSACLSSGRHAKAGTCLVFSEISFPFTIIPDIIRTLRLRGMERLGRPWAIVEDISIDHRWPEGSYEADDEEWRKKYGFISCYDLFCSENQYKSNFEKLVGEVGECYGGIARGFFGPGISHYRMPGPVEVGLVIKGREAKYCWRMREGNVFTCSFGDYSTIAQRDENVSVGWTKFSESLGSLPKFYQSAPLFNVVSDMLLRAIKAVDVDEKANVYDGCFNTVKRLPDSMPTKRIHVYQ